MVGSTSLLDLDTLYLMGMVVHRNSHYIFTPTTEQPPAGGKDEDNESDCESGSESFLPSVIEPVGPSS